MSTPVHHREASRPPSYVVGQDARGHWLAVETHGLGGGVFVTRDAAVHYARDETCRRPGAVTVIDGSAAGALPPTLLQPSPEQEPVLRRPTSLPMC